MYLALPNGPADRRHSPSAAPRSIFLGLSGYALTSKRDFSFMGGFIFAGMMVVMIAVIANIFLQMPALSLAISSAIILLMSGFILFDTGRIVRGEETNYIMATYGIYLSHVQHLHQPAANPRDHERRLTSHASRMLAPAQCRGFCLSPRPNPARNQETIPWSLR